MDIANCKYIFNTTSAEIGKNASNYTGGGFTKATNEQLTFSCSSSGTYYLHVLTVDNAGNKKETISSAINIQKLVKWLIKDGQIVDNNYSTVPSNQRVNNQGGAVYFRLMPVNSWYPAGVFWKVSNNVKISKVIVELQRTTSTQSGDFYLYFGSDCTQNTKGAGIPGTFGKIKIAGDGGIERSIHELTLTTPVSEGNVGLHIAGWNGSMANQIYIYNMRIES